jgi:ABC-type oligopeptide transport system substrate-binding subunit
LEEAEKIMLRQHPIIPLYHSERTYMRSSRFVRGWKPRLIDNFPLDAVEIQP